MSDYITGYDASSDSVVDMYDVLDHPNIVGTDFEAESSGETKTTTVELRLTLVARLDGSGASGAVEAKNTFTTTFDVTYEDTSSVTTSGTAGTSIS